MLSCQPQEPYRAPESACIPFQPESGVCETSFTGGDIAPGEGNNWGTL